MRPTNGPTITPLVQSRTVRLRVISPQTGRYNQIGGSLPDVIYGGGLASAGCEEGKSTRVPSCFERRFGSSLKTLSQSNPNKTSLVKSARGGKYEQREREREKERERERE